MTRTRARFATAVAAPVLLALWAATPAAAHGAPTDPVSRVMACSPEGGPDARSAACRAAVAANGSPFTAWDNLRIANVNGRDRQIVPDGELCSGGLPAYRGLDLARVDWPSTRLNPGAALTMRYVSTIPHTGTFRLYLTEQGYDPTRPLSWSDLPEQPFAEVRDPALTNGAYSIRATLPKDRTGRHVLYTVWENSSTPDTYYSCSDVVFPETKPEPETTTRKPESAKKPSAGESTKKPETTQPTESPEVARSPDSSPVAQSRTAATTSAPDSGPSAPLLAGGAAAVLLLTGGAALAVRLRRR
ncbi:secreted cellulose-binding protein [Streptomyces davaonensis JCM 4913]|uniref:Secreted cellulose-binding protein n=1 Tax=Streptomyces davaonensis (strain DSM 101723 / JCM 4913 / KCC S-0913 / 768) TaxID=1214101 RepID=K4R0H1_STRDJ|nr:lytic polysaccharide monooxygenase [Streptomyces davaonensis]CCK26662.1 secreted cellulose-binding protein [Streptomyces davaonensis JCM 4913]